MNVSGERTVPLWLKDAKLPKRPQLKADESCETVVVGAGIAGLSTAYELVLAGRDVVVVDRGPVLGGMTSRTTAHLAPICDDGLSALVDMRGEKIATKFQRSQEAAVDRIEQHIHDLRIKCDFRRLDAFLFPAPDMTEKDALKQRNQEFEAAWKTRVAVESLIGVPLKGHSKSPVLRYPNQATFHPLKYLSALLNEMRRRGCRVYGNSPVISIEEREGKVTLRTEAGHSVHAGSAVIATNSPINDRLKLHSKMAPYRTYAMAFELPKGTLPDALYWDMADPYHYVRLHPSPDKQTDYLIAGGCDHKSGEADDGDKRFADLKRWIKRLVPRLGGEVTRWSGQVLDTIDYCGFIGRDPGSKNIYIATGDSGQGMTHGALAGVILKDLLVSGASEWEDVYDPARKTPGGVVNYVRENLTAIQNFAEYLIPGELSSGDDLKKGQGGILRRGLLKIAVCRDVKGKIHANSAVCTHLGCHVHWNSTEQCWDCPCHGSQFAPDGAVLNAPAISPLGKFQLPGRDEGVKRPNKRAKTKLAHP